MRLFLLSSLPIPIQFINLNMSGLNDSLIHEKLSCRDAAVFWSVGGGCIKQCFTFYCCLSGLEFPPYFLWSFQATCCNFIFFIYLLVHRQSIQLSPEAVAGPEKMTTSILKKYLVRDFDVHCTCRGKQSTSQHPRVPRNSLIHTEELHVGVGDEFVNCIPWVAKHFDIAGFEARKSTRYGCLWKFSLSLPNVEKRK